MPTTNQEIADAVTRHRLWLLRHESGAVRDIVRVYMDATADLVKLAERLARKTRRGEPLTLEDRRDLRLAVRKMQDDLRAARADMERLLLGRMEEATEVEARRAAEIIRAALPDVAGSTASTIAQVPAADAAVAILEPLGGRVWTHRLAVDLVEAATRIEAVVAQAVAEGQSIPRAARLLRMTSGVRETYRGRFTAIARTEIQRVANRAAMDTYAANRDVVGSVQYLATLDSRTCLVCAPRHNKVFPLGIDGTPIDAPSVPQHPRCRCFYAPVVKSWQELGFEVPPGRGERRNLDGSPATDMSFEQWLKRQPLSTQREVLGSEARLSAWRGNRLSLADFAVGQRVLPLGALRAQFPGALPPG